MKLINFTLLKKIVLLCVLLFILNMILNMVTKREGFYIVSTADSQANALSKKVQEQKEKSCSNCRETSSSDQVKSNCGEHCN